MVDKSRANRGSKRTFSYYKYPTISYWSGHPFQVSIICYVNLVMLSDFARTPYTSLEFNMCRTFVPTSGDVNSPVSPLQAVLNHPIVSFQQPYPPPCFNTEQKPTDILFLPFLWFAHGYTSTVASLATEPELLTQENC